MGSQEMKRGVKYSVIMIAVSIVLFALPSFAFATSYFNGGWKFVSNNGAAATIETQNPYASVGQSAWSMTTNGYNGYAQVGWRKRSWYTAPKYFYEYDYDPNGIWYRKELGSASSGSHNNFMVGCSSTTMYFKINSISYGTVSLSTIPFSRSVIEIFGETHSTADQCPGSNYNPVTMGSVRYKNTSNNWVNTTCSNAGNYGLGYGDLTTMRNNISSSGSSIWEIWDSRY